MYFVVPYICARYSRQERISYFFLFFFIFYKYDDITLFDLNFFIYIIYVYPIFI